MLITVWSLHVAEQQLPPCGLELLWSSVLCPWWGCDTPVPCQIPVPSPLHTWTKPVTSPALCLAAGSL